MSPSSMAAPSTAHPEDSQPNELVTRKRMQPPSVGTPTPPRRSHVLSSRAQGANTVLRMRPINGAHREPMLNRTIPLRTDPGSLSESSSVDTRPQMNSAPKFLSPAADASRPPRWDHAYRLPSAPSHAMVKDSQTAVRSLGAPSSSHSVSSFSSLPSEVKPLEDFKDLSVPTWNLSLKRSPSPEKKVAISPPPFYKRRKLVYDPNAIVSSTVKEQVSSQQIFPTHTPLSSNILRLSVNTEPVPEQSELSKVETAGLRYLEAYIQHFDEDRLALANAYAPTAVFSYRIHNLSPLSSTHLAAKRFAPHNMLPLLHGSPSQIGCVPQQGRSEVINALRSLGPHSFCSSGFADVQYDLLDLGETMGLLLICYGSVIDELGTQQLSVTQTFILRKAHERQGDGSTEGTWPFVAVSHQMAIRDLSQLPTLSSDQR